MAKGEIFLNEPKISVVVPLYNRKYYIEDCISSVLNQSFQDFEIIIRDDFSSDGVCEFVEKIFSAEISSGKIKLFRNSENLGESATLKKLFKNATGKYITILHNDDLYLKNALEHLYKVAEKFHADVVHSTGVLTSPKDGTIKDGSTLKRIFHDAHNVENIEVMPSDLKFRFNEWLYGGIFQDAQYNIFRRKFLFESNMIEEMDGCDNSFLSLLWIMKAKIFVKTPEIFYIHRDSPDSQTNDRSFSPQKLERNISTQIKLFRQVDKFLSDMDFFKDDKISDYLVKAKIFMAQENLDRDKILNGNKNYAELYKLTEDIFKKIFGSDGVYLALLYHWGHIMQFKKSEAKKLLLNCLKTLDNDI
ncbi:MAG: glycosyltransferase family 2 protein [Selenomonadaceae bacterium]|nr:glycosyltransferase family 2 protein [Selenomonadaceae bacterium]